MHLQFHLLKIVFLNIDLRYNDFKRTHHKRRKLLYENVENCIECKMNCWCDDSNVNGTLILHSLLSTQLSRLGVVHPIIPLNNTTEYNVHI